MDKRINDDKKTYDIPTQNDRGGVKRSKSGYAQHIKILKFFDLDFLRNYDIEIF